MGDGFELAGVVHLVRPLHLRAANLHELAEGVSVAPAASLFYHAVQCQLRASAGDDQSLDDFSAWVNGVVQDREVAERLSFAVQNAGGPAEALRRAVLGTLGALSDAARRARAAPPGGEFQFLAVDSVTMPTGEIASSAAELMDLLARAEACVWFHHFVEQPWFEPATPGPAAWLEARGERRLARWLEEAARSGRPIEAVRQRVLTRWKRREIGRRVAADARQTEGERAAAGREAVAGLVRRITQGEKPA